MEFGRTTRHSKGQYLPQSAFRALSPDTAGGRHDPLTRTLHWVFAIGIIYATIIGYALHFIAEGQLHTALSHLNMSLASVLIVLFPIRVWWRLVRRDPPPPSGLTPAQLRPARLIQAAIYATIGEVLISGYLMVPKSYMLFGAITVPTPFDGNPATQKVLHLFYWAHRAGCATLAGLVVLHVAGVIMHTVIRPIGLLRRMV